MEDTPLAVVAYPALVGAVLAGIRKEKGLSQAEVAEAVAIGVSTWSRIENGESALSIEQLAGAADRLGIAPSSVLQAVEEKIALLRKKNVGTVPARADAQVATALGSIPIVGASLAAALGPLGVLGAAAVTGYMFYKNKNAEPEKGE